MTKALVVDPDAVCRESVENVLDDLGIEHDFTESAEEALVIDSKHDLYIIESMLQGMDGVQLSARLRASGDAPIIILSNCCETPWKVAGYFSGADVYLCKPIDEVELKLCVMSVLRRANR